ncbi:Rv3235 family protein [Nocardia sp. NPDC049526]|uniref:Rv3235 family protein n=1 Tax=Nocardia sp. NPDC049526 TaxID=3364316 RepID=UPI00379712E1
MERHSSGLSYAPRTEPPLLPYRPAGSRAEFEDPPRASPCRTPLSRNDQTGRAGPPGVRRALGAGHAELPPVVELDSTAQQFVERALRLALEILDHRRPVAQLTTMATPAVVSAVRTIVRADLAPGRTLRVAVLYRAGVMMVDASTAEVFATYDRGRQHFAIAARIARTRSTDWRLTAFRVR